MKAKFGLLLIAVFSLGAGGGTEEKKNLDKFAGRWDLNELSFDGKELTVKFKILFKGAEGIVEGNDRVANEYAKIKFKLDPAAKPSAIDLTVTAGSQTDLNMKGIYEIKGDELRMCVKVLGNERPTEFAAPEGSSTVYLVLKRAQ